MELVAASKMRRAVANVLATRPYAELAWQVALDLAQKTKAEHHPLLQKRPVRKIAFVLISSNRGLCGGFNNQISLQVLREVQKYSLANQASAEIITLGKRGRDILRRYNLKITADFIKSDLTTSLTELGGLTYLVLEEFKNGNYDQVILAYNKFISSLVQRPRLKQLLPLEQQSEKSLGTTADSRIKLSPASKSANQFEYLFEPNPKEVLNYLLPKLIEMQLYQAVLESEASEHSARMLAMRNASDAAKDTIDDLTLAYNQARQAGITKEIAEISAGKLALER